MISYNDLKSSIIESTGVLHSFNYEGLRVVIDKSLQIFVDGVNVGVENSIQEARDYAIEYISTSMLIEESSPLSEEKLVSLIRKHHSDIRVTPSILEEYTKSIEDDRFSIDPVIHEVKERTSFFSDKIEHTLNDGTKVAIDEETQHILNSLLQDKYEVIQYMQECKQNFMRVVKELEV